MDNVSPLLSGAEVAQFIGRGSIALTRDEYDSLLQYLHATGRPYHSVYKIIAHPEGVIFLPPTARKPNQVHISGRTFSCETSHKGNSLIRFSNPATGRLDTGTIEKIWTIPLQNSVHTFFAVRPHSPLNLNEEPQAPFHAFEPEYAVRIVAAVSKEKLVIIEKGHIVSHLATLWRKEGTYSIPRATLVVSWSLGRDRT